MCLMYWSKIIYRLGGEKSPQTSLSLVNRENNVVVNGLHSFTKISASFIHSLPQWTTRSPKISSGLSLSYRGYGCKSEKCFCACTVFVSHLCMICFSLRFFFTERSLNHQNPGATIPLEQMIPNVSRWLKT